MASGAPREPDRAELAHLLDEINALQARLGSRSPIDTGAVDAELSELAARLRASEAKLKGRRRLDTRRGA